MQKPVTVNESADMAMYKPLSSLNLSQTFPNVESAQHIYLCIMVSSASGERSSSVLGRVQGDLRSPKGQDRLSMLTLMSIEHELYCALRSLDFTGTMEFALAKACKKAISHIS